LRPSCLHLSLGTLHTSRWSYKGPAHGVRLTQPRACTQACLPSQQCATAGTTRGGCEAPRKRELHRALAARERRGSLPVLPLRRPAAAGAMPAALCACLAWLLLCWQATAAAPGLGQPPQRRPHPHHRMPQDQARTAAQREVPARRQPRTRSVSATAPDLGAEDFLGSCGFTVADLPKAGVKWHTASSACSILGKLDGFVFVGDSVTRQVRLPARLGHCHATRKRQGQRPIATESSVSRSVLACAEPFGSRVSAAAAAFHTEVSPRRSCLSRALLAAASQQVRSRSARARSCTRRSCSCCWATYRAARCGRTRPGTSSAAASATSRATATAASTPRPGRSA